MEAWRKTWREGIVPLLSYEDIWVIKNALETDDPNLIQGSTCIPPPYPCMEDWEVESACLLAYPGVIRFGGFRGNQQHSATVGDVENWFADLCFKCDKLMGETASCRYFLNWYDETPRDKMRELLLEEIDGTLLFWGKK